MSIKHALVVDDSKSAQIALKNQLEAHDLVVALAGTGEEALEFLEHETVDVIFLDHVMPGMDGFQALQAIKRNPRTAMIPVMMYTTKEGEVYVSQARALGGIGVLPKDVKPNVLFDMLLSLGLVKERRTESLPAHDTPRRRATDPAPAESTPRSDSSTGFPLAALLNRIMDDQVALRADLRRDRSELAHSVANEVVEAQRRDQASSTGRSRAAKTLAVLTALFAVSTVVLGVLAWNLAHTPPPTTATPIDDGSQRAQISDLETALHVEQVSAEALRLRSLDALQWSLNQQTWFPYEELPFNDARAELLRDLLGHLTAMGFRGRVRIESHLGEFCLVNDPGGDPVLAAPDTPIEACTLIGHPQDDSTFVADRQSVAFAEFLDTSPLLADSGITVELIAHDRARSLARLPIGGQTSRAGDWNRIAERNNRLEFSLIPDGD